MGRVFCIPEGEAEVGTGTSLDPGFSVPLTQVPGSVCSQESVGFHPRACEVGSDKWVSELEEEEFKPARTSQRDPAARKGAWLGEGVHCSGIHHPSLLSS